MACTAVAFALVVLTLAGVAEAKQNTIVEMTRLRRYAGGKVTPTTRRMTSAYASGSGATASSSATTPGASSSATGGGGGGAAGPKVDPTAKITQTLTITSVTAASYSGLKKEMFEGAYGVELKIATIVSDQVKYAAGCSVTSSAVAARRTGVKITFVARVSTAKKAVAESSAKVTTGATFVTSIATVKTGVSKFSAQTTPVASTITAGTPLVEVIVSGASSLTVSLFAIIALSFGVVLR